MRIAPLALLFVALAAVACGSGDDEGDTTTGGAGGSTPDPNAPSGSLWEAIQDNASCNTEPGQMTEGKAAGEACESPNECMLVCCPCADGKRSYWGAGCTKGQCAADGRCSVSQSDVCP